MTREQQIEDKYYRLHELESSHLVNAIREKIYELKPNEKFTWGFSESEINEHIPPVQEWDIDKLIEQRKRQLEKMIREEIEPRISSVDRFKRFCYVNRWRVFDEGYHDYQVVVFAEAVRNF